MLHLDAKDKRILAVLDKDARTPNSRIAKMVGLSNPAVEYRLQRFEKNDIIFTYYAVINFTRLGYSQYKAYFKLQNAGIPDEHRILEHWKRSANTVWVAQVRGHWDVAVSILARTNYEFGALLREFMNAFSQFILEKDVLLTEYSPIYARGYLPDAVPGYLPDAAPTEFTYGVPSEIQKLDKIDCAILSTLAVNARMPIVELSSTVKLSRDIVAYRIKKLTQDGVLVQYRCFPNLPAIGLHHYKVIMRLSHFDQRAEARLKEYIASHKKATQLLKLVGSWDVEIEFETEGEDELYAILSELRKQFSGIIRDYDILRILATVKYNYFPFSASIAEAAT